MQKSILYYIIFSDKFQSVPCICHLGTEKGRQGLLLTAHTALEHWSSVVPLFRLVILILCLLSVRRLDRILHVPGGKTHMIMHLGHQQELTE